MSVRKSLGGLLLTTFCWGLAFPQQTFEYREVMVPMRDGVKLATSLFLPNDGKPAPVVLLRTPYDKGDAKNWEANIFAGQGYAVVAQDTRGRFHSEGAFEPFLSEPSDGYDTQEWIAQQPWCNGRIALYGASYVGFTAWASAARTGHCVKMMATTAGLTDPYGDMIFSGGAFRLGSATLWSIYLNSSAEEIKAKGWKYYQDYVFSPLTPWKPVLESRIPYLLDWMANPSDGPYWKARGSEGEHAQVRIPTLSTGGWFDIFAARTLENFNRLRHEAEDLAMRRNHFVIMGPWAHGTIGKTQCGEIDFGDGAKIDLGKRALPWLDYWLRGQNNTGVEDWRPLYIFVMGINQWRGEDQWPPAGTEFTSYYLHSSGKANTLQGDGLLLAKAPAATEKNDQFTYDPADPVPSLGGNMLFPGLPGPFDQREIEKRQDVLVYTTEPMQERLEVTGPIKMVLFARSTAPDTDFTAKLVDVFPDGKAINLCNGILRARYRESLTNPTLIEPGKIYKYEISVGVTANVFLPGHRIRLEISSSCFPEFDRNPNTGEHLGKESRLEKAIQTVLHDQNHPSHLILPIVRR